MNFSNACLGKLVCGACERELPDSSYSVEQRGLRESSRRCEECVAAGTQLVLMKKGRTRSEGDDCVQSARCRYHLMISSQPFENAA